MSYVKYHGRQGKFRKCRAEGSKRAQLARLKQRRSAFLEILEMIKLKRVYDKENPDDGVRYLVERLWPRGVKKTSLRINGWLKNAAPSTELRKWFSHDPEKWQEFRRKYFVELGRAPEAWAPIRDAARRANVTLLYSSHDTEHNNAVALKEFIEHQGAARIRTAGGHTGH